MTGPLRSVDSNVTRKLFPHLGEKEIIRLDRLKEEDYLIGMRHASWHPERAEKCKSGGDLWIYRGRFGSCIGGKHPEIRGTSSRSKALFAVNHVYPASIIRSPGYTMSHEIEFCPDRGKEYFQAGVLLSCGSDVVNPAVGVLSCASEIVNPAVTGVLSCASEVVNPAVGVLSCASEVVNPAVGVLSCASDVVNPAVGVGNSAPGALNPAPDNLHQATGEGRTVCFGTKAALFSKERMFFDSESLGTFVEPKCGGCLCTKCPVPGSKYSFTEQKEFDIISKKLFYDEQNKRCCTELPWRYERSTLPRNKDVALKYLIATERNLFRDPEWAETYCAQIQDMVDRGSAVMLTRKEIDEWAGDYHYLPHLAVRQLKKRLQCDCVLMHPENRRGTQV